MSEATVGVFHHAAVHNIFGNTGGRVLMLVMTACGNFAFTWIFWPIFWSIFTKYSTCVIVQIWTTKYHLNKEQVWMIQISTWKIILL